MLLNLFLILVGLALLGLVISIVEWLFANFWTIVFCILGFVVVLVGIYFIPPVRRFVQQSIREAEEEEARKKREAEEAAEKARLEAEAAAERKRKAKEEQLRRKAERERLAREERLRLEKEEFDEAVAATDEAVAKAESAWNVLKSQIAETFNADGAAAKPKRKRKGK